MYIYMYRTQENIYINNIYIYIYNSINIFLLIFLTKCMKHKQHFIVLQGKSSNDDEHGHSQKKMRPPTYVEGDKSM